LVPGTLRMSKNRKIVLMPKPAAAKPRPGKSFRSERTQQ
jgi:hypothetical protein